MTKNLNKKNILCKNSTQEWREDESEEFNQEFAR